MSDSVSNIPPLPPLPPEPAVAATPAGQRVQSWGNRAWRAFGTTPWWRLVAGGMIVIIGMLSLAVPFDSIMMANKIRSQAAKDALRNALHLEVLERARGGLVLARGVAVGSEQVDEIDAAIVDIERQLARPIATERFDGSLKELLSKIDAQRVKRNDAVARLNVTATKLAQSKPELQSELAEKIRDITDEIESASESLATLEEQRAEMEATRSESEANRAQLAAERAAREAQKAALEATRRANDKNSKGLPVSPPAPLPPLAPLAPTPPDAQKPSRQVSSVTTTTIDDVSTVDIKGGKSPAVTITTKDGKTTAVEVGLFGRDKLAVETPTTNAASLGFQSGEPSAQVIRDTISRDAKKGLVAGFAAALLTILFLFMLIARSFAGRAARGEQRAVIAESRERTESHARQLAEARLTLMRAQVEPHFLFNTLAHVQALQEIDPPQAGTMLERLISYLRAAMPSMRETKSTLGREVEVVRAYLDLLKIRMGERLKYFINVPEDMNGVALPPTMIATLVENAIKHGLEPKKEGGSIAVQVRKLEANEGHPARMEVLVADDGLGFGAADTSGTGVGLANTRERLKMLYGSQAELAVEPNAPSGVRAIIRVPLMVPETIDEVHDEPVFDTSNASISPFAIQMVVLLAVCFGWLGVHRFYVGKLRTGAMQAALGLLSIITGGLAIFLIPLIVWVVLDIVWISTREFRDSKARRIVHLRSKDVGHEPASAPGVSSANVSTCTIQVVALLTLFFGVFGVHRFYVGRYRTGALQAGLFALSIITGGLPIFLLPLVMWLVLDLAWVLSRDFRDAQGRRIMRRDSDDRRTYSATQVANRRADPSVSQSSRGIALLLAIPLGWCGVHRFYVGRVGTGLAMLFTLGGLGIWWIVDIVMVATGQLKDMDGKWVSEWE
jgi:TM2 domain-containing membrane protein YozV